MPKKILIPVSSPNFLWFSKKPYSSNNNLLEKLTIPEVEKQFNIEYSENILASEELSNKTFGHDPQYKSEWERIENYLKNPINDKLVICFIDEKVGHGVFAKDYIKAGTIVAIYAGEVTNRNSVNEFSDYGMIINDNKGSNFAVDAKKIGGIARFVQHMPFSTKNTIKFINTSDLDTLFPRLNANGIIFDSSEIEDLRKLGKVNLILNQIKVDELLKEYNKELDKEINTIKFSSDIENLIACANLKQYSFVYNQKPIIYFEACVDIMPGEQLGVSYAKGYWLERKIFPEYFYLDGSVIPHRLYTRNDPQKGPSDQMFKRIFSRPTNQEIVKMKNKLILIGDIHDESTAVKLLIALLPQLRAAGFRTLYKEVSQSPDPTENTPAELIEYNNRVLSLLRLFPGAVIPANPSHEQRSTMMIYQATNYDLIRELQLNKGREEWLRENNNLYQLIIQLEMELVLIDVQDPNEYLHPGGHERRTKFMFEKMQAKLEVPNNHGIVLVGFSHMINCWEAGYYNYGMLHHLDRLANLEIRAYLPWSTQETEATCEAFKLLSLCNKQTISHVHKLKITDNASIQQAITDILTDGLHHVLPEENSIRVTYQIPLIGDREQLRKYLEHLGAKIKVFVKGYIIVEMASQPLDKGRREMLHLDRRRIPKLQEIGIEELKTKPEITIEKESEKLLVTFPKTPNNTYYGFIENLIKKYELPTATITSSTSTTTHLLSSVLNTVSTTNNMTTTSTDKIKSDSQTLVCSSASSSSSSTSTTASAKIQKSNKNNDDDDEDVDGKYNGPQKLDH